MSGYDRRNRCVFSFRRNTSNDGADVTSSERLFQTMREPVEANDQSPTVTRLTNERQDGWTTLTGGDFATACQRHDVVGRTDIEEPCRVELGQQ